MEKIRNITLRNYIEYFYIFSLLGWLYEVLVCNLLVRSTLKNCGFLFGPWLPIYGFGMVIMIFLYRRFKVRRPIDVFFAMAVVSTVMELIASYFLEYVNGRWLWDYHYLFLNYEGRIALPATLAFGLLALVAMYIILPYVDKIKERYPLIRDVLFTVITALFAADVFARFFFGSNLPY